jgi:mannosylglycerate hydrolase
VESPRHYPDNDLVEERRVLAWVPEVEGYGTRSFRLTGGRARPSVSHGRVTVDATSLDNGDLRVELGPGGAVSIAAVDLGFAAPDVLRFESTADRGDSYTPSLIGDPIRASFLGARVSQRGPLRGELETRWRLLVPVRRFGGAVPLPDRRTRGRAAPRVAINVTARLALDAGAPFVRIVVAGANRAHDHRLRAVIGTGLVDAHVWADAAFGPVERVPLAVPPADAARETPPRTAPLHRYVSLYAPRAGATVFSDGLAEYEATDAGEVAVTLVRAIGELSRNDLPERPGHAGWPLPTPESQSLGPFAAALALMPHGPRDVHTLDAVERAADDVLLPLTGTTLRSALALPEPTRGAHLDGTGLSFGALKESEDGRWLVARCVNVTEVAARGRWSFGFPLREARLARLDETPLEPLEVEGTSVTFDAPPRGVITVLAR